MSGVDRTLRRNMSQTTKSREAESTGIFLAIASHSIYWHTAIENETCLDLRSPGEFSGSVSFLFDATGGKLRLRDGRVPERVYGEGPGQRPGGPVL